jgi:hypothetical protein
VRSRAARPLRPRRTSSSGLREGDTSMRIRGVRNDDAYGELLPQAHALADILSASASARWRRQISSAPCSRASTSPCRVRRRRPPAPRQPRRRDSVRPQERADEHTRPELGLAECLSGPTESVRSCASQRARRWAVRRGRFREAGSPRSPRAHEPLPRLRGRSARPGSVIRVLGHELNNSLTPIRSRGQPEAHGAGTADAEDREDLARADHHRGARGRARASPGYARLARVPSPKFASVDLGPLLSSIAALETRIPISVSKGRTRFSRPTPTSSSSSSSTSSGMPWTRRSPRGRRHAVGA